MQQVTKQKIDEAINEYLQKIPLNLKVYASYNTFPDVDGGGFSIYDVDNDMKVASFNISAMTGCRGVAISHKAEISELYRGKGYGAAFTELREIIAKQMNYGCIMCSVVFGNHPQQKVMLKRKWRILERFTNPRTTNQVQIYFKQL